MTPGSKSLKCFFLFESEVLQAIKVGLIRRRVGRLWQTINGENIKLKKVCYPTTDKTPRLRARPNRAAQAASDKEADSQTEEAVATIAEVQHQEQPQAGGPAQEAAAEPVETGAKPGRANQGTQTVEQQPVIHSVNHKFFLLTKRE
uniref:Uncharacterized protein n=1 Tax=Solanum tuberosum TaxID=4113 RepID=M1A380_SOLTU